MYFLYALLISPLILFGQTEEVPTSPVQNIVIALKNGEHIYVLEMDDISIIANEGEALIEITEAGSGAKEKIKPNVIDSMGYTYMNDTIVVRPYNTKKRRKQILLEKIWEKDDYCFLRSPKLGQQIFYYIQFKDNFPGLIDLKTADFTNSFNCSQLIEHFKNEQSKVLTEDDAIARLSFFIDFCQKDGAMR